jgi:hypothetical protein
MKRVVAAVCGWARHMNPRCPYLRVGSSGGGTDPPTGSRIRATRTAPMRMRDRRPAAPPEPGPGLSSATHTLAACCSPATGETTRTLGQMHGSRRHTVASRPPHARHGSRSVRPDRAPGLLLVLCSSSFPAGVHVPPCAPFGRPKV